MSSPKVVTDKVTGESKLATRTSPPRKDRIFRRLEASVPRAELTEALAAAGTSDEKAEMLMMMLMDPAFKRSSLPMLAKQCGLSYAAVLKIITNHRIDQGILKMSAHAPQVLEDIAIDAKSRLVPCPACKGVGTIVKAKDKEGGPIDVETCWSCEGEGKLRKVGDADARKLLMETMGLTGKKGPLVVQQFNNGSAPTMDEAVSSVSEIIDVTPIRASETAPASNEGEGGSGDH